MKFSSQSAQFNAVRKGQMCSHDTNEYLVIQSGETSTGKSAKDSSMDDKPPVLGACSQSTMDAWSRSTRPETQGMTQFLSHNPQCTAECVDEVMRGDLKKPATYNGKSSWQDYYIQFEMVQN